LLDGDLEGDLGGVEVPFVALEEAGLGVDEDEVLEWGTLCC
jgi:hypothetical protein